MKKNCLLAMFSAVLLLPVPGVAGDTWLVDCNAGNTIQGAMTSAKSGDTLLVSGTCRENVQITGWDLILDGQGTATISGPDSSAATIELMGVRNLTVKGFRVTAGRDGIVVNAGQMVALENNKIGRASCRERV